MSNTKIILMVIAVSLVVAVLVGVALAQSISAQNQTIPYNSQVPIQGYNGNYPYTAPNNQYLYQNGYGYGFGGMGMCGRFW